MHDFNQVSVIAANLNSLSFRCSDIKPIFAGSDRAFNKAMVIYSVGDRG